jgi:hypothetical protein
MERNGLRRQKKNTVGRGEWCVETTGVYLSAINWTPGSVRCTKSEKRHLVGCKRLCCTSRQGERTRCWPVISTPLPIILSYAAFYSPATISWSLVSALLTVRLETALVDNRMLKRPFTACVFYITSTVPGKLQSCDWTVRHFWELGVATSRDRRG